MRRLSIERNQSPPQHQIELKTSAAPILCFKAAGVRWWPGCPRQDTVVTQGARASPGAAAEVLQLLQPQQPALMGTIPCEQMEWKELQNKGMLQFSLSLHWDYISLEHPILKSSIIWFLIILAKCHLLNQNRIKLLKGRMSKREALWLLVRSQPHLLKMVGGVAGTSWRKKWMARWCCGGSATIIASATKVLCKGIQGIRWAFHMWSKCSSFSVMWDMKLWDQVYQSTEHSDLLLELEFAIQGFEK